MNLQSADGAGIGASDDAVMTLPVEAVEAGLVDLLTVHDAEGHYLYVSPSFEAVTGLALERVQSESPFDLALIHPDDVSGAVEALSLAIRSTEPTRARYRLRRSDDTYVWVESLGIAITAGGRTHLVATTREVGHVESLMQGLAYERRLKNQLDELVERQRRFLTTVSHRARTPLTVVVGMTELLRAHGDRLEPERRAVMLERLGAHSERLVELLTEVTDADRLVRSDMVLQRRVVDLQALAQAVLDERAQTAARVHNRVEPGLTAVVDRARVRRLLGILVGNAIEHAGLGATIHIRARRRNDGVELLVEDDGPGVADASREVIFEPFSHAEGDSPDPGSGLGLYIVAELAALHGGRAWVDDRPGGGARFHVWLPRPRGNHGPTNGTGGQHTERRGLAAAALGAHAQDSVGRLLRGLQQRVGLDTVYLSILDGDHQHVLATSTEGVVAGIQEGVRIPLADTYCARMIADEIDHVVTDTAAHPELADLPATADGLACYVGVPVHLPSGHVFGSLCGAGTSSRDDLPPSAADEFAVFADILGQQLADEGFIHGSVMDAAGRVADVLTRPGAIRPVFQPIVSLATGNIAEVEALARFDGHHRPIDLWFTDAARAGLLVDLETAAIRVALDRLDQLPDAVSMALNVSPRTLQSSQLTDVLADVPLDRLVLEITEHAAVADYQPLRTALGPLRADGLRLAIDDVGTGFAGLGHLLQLHPDIIKVDRSLVTTMATDPAHRSAATGLAQMAAHLGADLVAEGVETPDILPTLHEVGFTHAQGYVFARPESDHDLEQVEQAARQLLASHSAA